MNLSKFNLETLNPQLNEGDNSRHSFVNAEGSRIVVRSNETGTTVSFFDFGYVVPILDESQKQDIAAYLVGVNN